MAQSVMSRAWKIAQKSAKRWGGTASQYQPEALKIANQESAGLVSEIENTWKMQDTRTRKVKKTRTVETKEWVEVPEEDLPVVKYYYTLQGTDWTKFGGTTAAQNEASLTFWMKNRGIGNNPDLTDDDIDLSDYKNFEDGIDATAADFIIEFFFVVKDAINNPVKYENGIIYEEITTEEEQEYTVLETYIIPRKYYGWKEEDD